MFIKKRVQHRCFSVKFGKFLRTSFFYRAASVSEKVDDIFHGGSFHVVDEGERFCILAYVLFPYSHRKITMKREYRFYIELHILKLLLLYRIY